MRTKKKKLEYTLSVTVGGNEKYVALFPTRGEEIYIEVKASKLGKDCEGKMYKVVIEEL